jgi:tetratricopeptide (TPR) repeat protein
MNRLLATFLWLALCILPNAPASAATAASARKVSGEAVYRANAQSPYTALTAGTALAQGGWVKTGANGWLELALADGSTITLANNSELELTSIKMGKGKREGLLNLAQGKLRANVVKLAGTQADIKIKSGTAVAGVKGTDFLMMTEGPANVFFGNEGRVAIRGKGKKESLMAAGTMTQTTRGNYPLEPLTVDMESPLADAMKTFNTITGEKPPAEWTAGNALPLIIARWNINYGHYLADRGNYQEALSVFQIAIDLTQNAEIRADAWLERGTVQGRFLDNPRAALAEFLLVLEEYPNLPQAEIALFSAGQTLYELKLYDQAFIRLNQYLQKYPSGRNRSTTETLLNAISTLTRPGAGR